MDIEEIVKKALEEDIGSGDITTDAVLRCSERFDGKVSAVIIARASGILCGIDIARMVFNIVDNNLGFDAYKDGAELSTNQRVVCIKGS
ncbi:nicotinate-nucleotide diphosphorylase (carboxylating), partial [candidate division WOR-3 bacterium]|nr:nicotinate-nucleotide diphosphorylase (carboxylating) [candidate division WOR-3 bacterium]